MKYVKMLGLLAVAAAAMMAFAATASATTLTSPAGVSYTGEIHAESEGATTLDGPSDITCNNSTVSGHVEKHGAEVTASGKLTTLDFTNCNQHVTVKKAGELIAHTDDPKKADGNAILTSVGAEVEVVITGLGITCVYSTAATGTVVGTLTGSTTKHATLDIDSSPIPRTGGSFFCGSSAEWTGNYTVTTPSTLYVH